MTLNVTFVSHICLRCGRDWRSRAEKKGRPRCPEKACRSFDIGDTDESNLYDDHPPGYIAHAFRRVDLESSEIPAPSLARARELRDGGGDGVRIECCFDVEVGDDDTELCGFLASTEDRAEAARAAAEWLKAGRVIEEAEKEEAARAAAAEEAAEEQRRAEEAAAEEQRRAEEAAAEERRRAAAAEERRRAEEAAEERRRAEEAAAEERRRAEEAAAEERRRAAAAAEERRKRAAAEAEKRAAETRAWLETPAGQRYIARLQQEREEEEREEEEREEEERRRGARLERDRRLLSWAGWAFVVGLVVLIIIGGALTAAALDERAAQALAARAAAESIADGVLGAPLVR